jgi:hypothetical protein
MTGMPQRPTSNTSRNSRQIYKIFRAPAARSEFTLAATMPPELPVEQITRSILYLRGQRVILDSDLAAIYGVTTGRFNEAVKRNIERFPEDFMFRLTAKEYGVLTSQTAISKLGRGGRRQLPWAFTEHGAIQASNVLNSPRAIAMGTYVVRAFVQLRDLIVSDKAMAQKLNELEHKLENHDDAIVAILSAIRQLMNPPTTKRRAIGFTAKL